ncbi:hypothetical protein CRENPOLYSF1_270070 [Crenothrix polyspora]|uniref:Uncharacterized protein n=1 Tax=Crenothrix polyspora TaxID=360316 RepID=A0A1R4H7U1_9GAMM|nr:hypothetical protein CRENPOLYSF1_270070 [Crenothrix polyspora]
MQPINSLLSFQISQSALRFLSSRLHLAFLIKIKTTAGMPPNVT